MTFSELIVLVGWKNLKYIIPKLATKLDMCIRISLNLMWETQCV